MQPIHPQNPSDTRREKVLSFCWQHLLLLVSLFIMTIGVAVCVRSMLGSSVISVAACYAFFGKWQWHIIGIGTLFAMFYVGFVVRFAGRHLGWFRHLLSSRPGFRRYIYGLARFIYRR